MTLSNYKRSLFFILIISIFIFTPANSSEVVPHNDYKKHAKIPHLVTKNQVLDLFKIRQVCMDVCNPPYNAQEYPPSYGNQNNQYAQYYPSGSYGYEGYDGSQNYYPQIQNGQYSQYYPSISYGYGGNDGSQNYYPQIQNGQYSQYYPSISYGYGGYDGTQNYYPQNQNGQYYLWCYRDMFKKRFKFDPGNRKPRIFHYKKSINGKSSIYRRNRNYNFFQDNINCQRICYPMMVPQVITTAKTKVTKTRTTRMSTTTTESSESDESSDVSDASVSSSEKPENTTTTATSAVITNSTTSPFFSNGTNESSQSIIVAPEASGATFLPSQKPQGSVKSKRKAYNWNKKKEERKKN